MAATAVSHRDPGTNGYIFASVVMDEETWGLGSERGAAVDEQFVRLMTHHHHNMLCSRDEEMVAQRQQEKEHIKTTSAQRVAKNQPEKVKARKTARAETKAKKQVTDRPGVYDRCITAYMETLKRDAPIRPQYDECKRSKTDCIKVKKSCRGYSKKHYKCTWKNTTMDELRDHPLVLRMLREIEMESEIEGEVELPPRDPFKAASQSHGIKGENLQNPKINQVFPPTEATSRKPYQSSKPSSHADPTIISLERHKDDEGSSRKDAATSLEDGSPRQSYISDAEAPRKKRKLSHIRDQGHSATGNSDNNSSGTGNLDGAPGEK
ncbi:MAG: hypothetical protein LQ349_000101 [Xanthoria aureola]|nr:MAG: hypothetical protein LQ349_000101 [Xanthoria aureola]